MQTKTLTKSEKAELDEVLTVRTDNPVLENYLQDIIHEHGIYNEQHVNSFENPDGKILSIFHICVTGTNDESECSDIDMDIVFREKYLAVKHTLDEVVQSMEPYNSFDYDIYAVDERWFKNPVKYMRRKSQDPRDSVTADIANTLMFYEHVMTASQAYAGREVKDLIEDWPELNSLDGFDYLILMQSSLARGLYGRNKEDMISFMLDKNPTQNRDALEEAFDSYLDKRRTLTKSELDKDLNKDENLVRKYISGKDTQLAKSVLKSTYGLNILFGGRPLGNEGEKGQYEVIKDEVLSSGLIGTLEDLMEKMDLDSEKLNITDLITHSHEVKVNRRREGGVEYDAFFEWDWLGNGQFVDTKEGFTNLDRLDRILGFLDFAKQVAYKEAFNQGYFWTPERNESLNKRLVSKTPEIVNLAAGESESNRRARSYFMDVIINAVKMKDLVSEHINDEVKFVDIQRKAIGLLEDVAIGTNVVESPHWIDREFTELDRGNLFSAVADAYEESNDALFGGYHEDALSHFDRLLKATSKKSSGMASDLDLAEVYLGAAHSLLQLRKVEGSGKLKKAHLEKAVEYIGNSIKLNPRAHKLQELLSRSEISQRIDEQYIEDSLRSFLGRIVEFDRERGRERLKSVRSMGPIERNTWQPRLEALDHIQDVFARDVEDIPAELLLAAQKVYQTISHQLLKKYRQAEGQFIRHRAAGLRSLKPPGLEEALNADRTFEEVYAERLGVEAIEHIYESSRETTGTHIRLGDIDSIYDNLQQGQFEEALDLCRAILTSSGEDAAVWEWQSQAQEGLGDYIGSGASLLKAIELAEDESFYKRASQIRAKISRGFEGDELYFNLPPGLRGDAFDLASLFSHKTYLSKDMDMFYQLLRCENDVDAPLESLIRNIVDGLFERGFQQRFGATNELKAVFTNLEEYIMLAGKEGLPELEFEDREKRKFYEFILGEIKR